MLRGFFYFVTFTIAFCICLALFGWKYYDAPGPLQAQTTVLLPRGAGLQGTGDTLTQAGVIDHPLVFKVISAMLGSGRKFKAGEYAFPVGATPHQVMDMLAQGKVVIHKITVPEGWNVRDVLTLVANEPALDGDLPKNIKEGSLMPETYHFTRGDKRADVIARMQTSMQALVAELWAKRQPDILVHMPEQAVTLASIVEKETGVAAERGHVASVFYNRLKTGMKLQSDPTVVYGMELAMGAPLGRPLTTLDLQTATPYNTYMIDALPPGPIANPGRASLEAVLNPLQTPDLYFVATGSGGHHFAATLEEHNRNVQAYREKMAVNP